MKTELLRKIININPQMMHFLDDLSTPLYLDLTYDEIIKFVYVLENKPSKRIYDFNESDAAFAITNQDRIEAILGAINRFLNKANLDQYYDISWDIQNKHPALPLMYIAYHLFYLNSKNNELRNYFENNHEAFIHFKLWLYRALLLGKFNNQKKTASPINELLSVFAQEPKSSLSFTLNELDSFDVQFVLFLVHNRDKHIHKDTIKPLMKPENFSKEAINNIRNLDSLYGNHLQIKDALSFTEWLNFCKKHSFIYINESLFPADNKLWDEDRFTEFCEARGKLIIEKINQIFSELATESNSK